MALSDREKIKKRWENLGGKKDTEAASGTLINTGIAGAVRKNDAAKFDEILRMVDPLIEQLNHLYKAFSLGIDRLPPSIKRSQLDQLMSALLSMHKGNVMGRFRFDTVNAKYLSHRERWDRMMKDIESGKIKRIVGTGNSKK